MKQLPSWLAISLSLAALVLLLVQGFTQPTTAPTVLEPMTFTPQQAMQEIEQLRSERGSILANTSLEKSHSPQEFSTALANYVGEPLATEVASEPPQEASLPLVQQLRQTARLLDAEANRKEDAEDYEAEITLRQLAQQLRQTAKTLKASDQGSTDP